MSSAARALVLAGLAVVAGCGDGAGGRPHAYLASGGKEVHAAEGSYCWAGECADTTGPGPGIVRLPVRRGEEVELRFDQDEAPSTLGASLDPAPPEDGDLLGVALRRDNPTSFVVDVPPGTYYLQISTDWSAGDATFFAELDVRGR